MEDTNAFSNSLFTFCLETKESNKEKFKAPEKWLKKISLRYNERA
jgi:hypothetical protein